MFSYNTSGTSLAHTWVFHSLFFIRAYGWLLWSLVFVLLMSSILDDRRSVGTHVWLSITYVPCWVVFTFTTCHHSNLHSSLPVLDYSTSSSCLAAQDIDPFIIWWWQLPLISPICTTICAVLSGWHLFDESLQADTHTRVHTACCVVQNPGDEISSAGSIFVFGFGYIDSYCFSGRWFINDGATTSCTWVKISVVEAFAVLFALQVAYWRPLLNSIIMAAVFLGSWVATDCCSLGLTCTSTQYVKHCGTKNPALYCIQELLIADVLLGYCRLE